MGRQSIVRIQMKPRVRGVRNESTWNSTLRHRCPPPKWIRSVP